MASIVITPPTQEPVTLDMVKSQSRVTHTLDDNLLLFYIAAARDHLQIVTRRQFLAATLQWRGIQNPPATLTLENPPLVSVSAVGTLDSMEIVTPLLPTEYVAITNREPGHIALLTPIPLTTVMQVTYVAGFATPEAMPQGLRQAMLLLVAHWYEHRESTIAGTLMCVPDGLEALIWANKLVTA